MIYIVYFLMTILVLEVLLILYFIFRYPLDKLYIYLNNKLNLLLDKWFDGHVSFFNITIYGRNAMAWGVNIKTKKYGYICFNLPIPMYGKIKKFYYYLSPNGTPWASTYYRFNEKLYDKDKELAKLRKESFGHNFDTEFYSEELSYINDNQELPIRVRRENVINDLLD